MWTENAPTEKLSKLSLEELEHYKQEVHSLICIYDYNPTDNTIFISLNKIWHNMNDEIKRRTEPTNRRVEMTPKPKEYYFPAPKPLVKKIKPIMSLKRNK